MINLPLLALALSTFGIGTTEFVIMGLLPNVASDLNVSIPMAGLLVTGYALAVAIGAPLMALATAKLQRRRALLILMGIFIIGNALCALSGNYTILMIARIVTALCHGAFCGIGSIEAASLAPENRKASAIALMFTGLTLANVLGVPFGTMMGQNYGWRSTFWVVTAIGVVAFAALAYFLPKKTEQHDGNVRAELRALRNINVWLALSITVFMMASIFTLFTYIAPILGDVTKISPRGVGYTLLLVGLGLTCGNIIGGRLTDAKPMPTLIGCLISVGILQIIFHWTSLWFIPAEITLFLWGMAFFAGCSSTHFNTITTPNGAPNLISTLSVSAFNTGNAIGAWAGSVIIAQGFGLRAVPLTASVFMIGALIMVVIYRRSRRNDENMLVSPLSQAAE